MNSLNVFVTVGLTIVFIVALLVVVSVSGFVIMIARRDRAQSQHAIRKNFPIISRIRYISEHLSPELRQYFFEGDHEGKPFSRLDFQFIVKAAKYAKTIIAFGSRRDFEKPGFYIRNAFFAKQIDELEADNEKHIQTKKYVIDKDTLFARHEHSEDGQLKPWHYNDRDAVIVGKETCRHPFTIKSPVA